MTLLDRRFPHAAFTGWRRVLAAKPKGPRGLERQAGAIHFWYLAISILWILGTDAIIARAGYAEWVGSIKDITYLVVCGFVTRRAVTHYLLGVRQAHAEQLEAKRELLGRLAMAAEYRDDETGGHNHRIARSAQILGRELGLDNETCDCLFYAAALHDLGKIAVPDGILHKPGPLTMEERTTMQRHPRLGAELLENSAHPLLRMAHDVALTHHERWDGTGYPHGLSRDAIPLSGRIVAVCDVFDALTSERPYKRAWSVEDAAAEIRRGGGAQFDPEVVQAFFRCLPEMTGVRAEAPRPWSAYGKRRDECAASTSAKTDTGNGLPPWQPLPDEQLSDARKAA